MPTGPRCGSTSSRQTRTSPTNMPGATCRPAAAAACGPRSTTCARAARWRGRCCWRRRRSAWACRRRRCGRARGAVIAGDRKLRYGELAEAAAQLPVPTKVTLKPESEWRIIGKPLPRLDTPGKLNGSAQYAIDVRLPGMLSASLAQSPVFGAKLVRFDADAVKSMPGIKAVVALGDEAVAVVADTWWQANAALKKLPISWSETPNGAVSSADDRHAHAGGADRRRCRRRPSCRRRGRRAGGQRQADRGDVRHAVPQSRDARTDELHRAGRW